MTISQIMQCEPSIDGETNKLFNDVLQMSDRWRIDRVDIFFTGYEWFAGNFRTLLIQTAITRRLFYRLYCASALSTLNRISFPMMYYFFPIRGTSLAYELSASNFGTLFVYIDGSYMENSVKLTSLV